MDHVNRVVNINKILERKGLFFLGPRQTGKSTFLKRNYPQAFYINLLDYTILREYKARPKVFVDTVEYQYKISKQRVFIIDEIQFIPELLNEVHRLIENYPDIRFILTGSSARKLKKSGVNLLGGRVSRQYLHPFCSAEIGIDKFVEDIQKNCNFGLLPSVYNSDNPWAQLQDYVNLYLKEEIQAEAIFRSLDGFSRFLNVVALTNAEQINFTQIANDAQVAPRAIREYYQVLEDTLIGFLLPAFTETKKRKAMSTAKFYLFDPGITNALLNRKSISTKTIEFGNLFEQIIHCELRAAIDYLNINQEKSIELYFWRSLSKIEVDFVLKVDDEYIGIEVKAKEMPNRKDYKGLLALEEDINLKYKIIVCLSESPRLAQDIEILPLKIFLENLWGRKYF